MKKIIKILIYLGLNVVYAQKEDITFGLGKIDFKGLSLVSEYNFEILRNLKVGVSLNCFSTSPFDYKFNSVLYDKDTYSFGFNPSNGQSNVDSFTIRESLFGFNLNARYNIWGLVKKESKFKFDLGLGIGWKNYTSLTEWKSLDKGGSLFLKRVVQKQNDFIAPNFDATVSYKIAKKCRIGLQFALIGYDGGGGNLLNAQVSRLF